MELTVQVTLGGYSRSQVHGSDRVARQDFHAKDDMVGALSRPDKGCDLVDRSFYVQANLQLGCGKSAFEGRMICAKRSHRLCEPIEDEVMPLGVGFTSDVDLTSTINEEKVAVIAKEAARVFRRSEDDRTRGIRGRGSEFVCCAERFIVCALLLFKQHD